MGVDVTTVEKIARLARVALSDHEKEAMIQDLDRILSFIETLQVIDVSGQKEDAPLPSELRRDEVLEGGQAAEILKNAPEKEHGMFAVPKVVEKGE